MSYLEISVLHVLKWSILETVTDIAKKSHLFLEEVIELSFSSRARGDFALANINHARKTSNI